MYEMAGYVCGVRSWAHKLLVDRCLTAPDLEIGVEVSYASAEQRRPPEAANEIILFTSLGKYIAGIDNQR